MKQLDAQLVQEIHWRYYHVEAPRTWIAQHIHHTHEQTASFHSLQRTRTTTHTVSIPWPHHQYQPRVYAGVEVVHQVVSLSQWCSLVFSLVYAFWGFVPKARCCQEPVHESQPELMKWKRTTGRNGTDITTIESQQLPRKQKYKRTIKAASKPMNDWNEATMEKND